MQGHHETFFVISSTIVNTSRPRRGITNITNTIAITACSDSTSASPAQSQRGTTAFDFPTSG